VLALALLPAVVGQLLKVISAHRATRSRRPSPL
jgi:hypothetical protein